MLIDENRMVNDIQARLDATTDPRHRDMLQLVIDHARAEAEADVDRVMATMHHAPDYRVHGAPESMSPRGWDGVRAFYERRLFAGERFLMGVEVERMVVDDDTVVTENVVSGAVPGWYLAKADSWPIGGQAVDPDGWYLMQYRMCTIWPFVDGKITGEEGYVHPVGVRPLSDAEVAEIPAKVRATPRM